MGGRKAARPPRRAAPARRAQGSGSGSWLRLAVKAGTPALRSISEAKSRRPRAPGKWSPREILGHLVDSASNNHQRFVRARSQEDLVFPGYEQEEWVRSQKYAEAPWHELVDLWRLYNLHLARVMEATPEAIRRRETTRHNFHRLLMRTIPEGAPARLEDLMRDYVAHLEHHLEQILGRPLLPQSAVRKGGGVGRSPAEAAGSRS